jgi:hypothetical protein
MAGLAVDLAEAETFSISWTDLGQLVTKRR